MLAVQLPVPPLTAPSALLLSVRPSRGPLNLIGVHYQLGEGLCWARRGIQISVHFFTDAAKRPQSVH